MKIDRHGFLQSSLTALAVCLMAMSGPALAAPGDIDPGFNGGAPALLDYNSSLDGLKPLAIATDPANGDVLWAGADVNSSTTSGLIVAYKDDGTLDTNVAGSGKISVSPSSIGLGGAQLMFESVAVDNQGRILVTGTGSESSGFDMVLARFNPDGTPDTSFGTNGVVKSAINNGALGSGLSLTADGHILVTGMSASTSTAAALLTLWRFNADGSPDTSFNGTGHVQIDGISVDPTAVDIESFRCFPALQPDRSILVGCQQAGSAGPWKMTRLAPDGSVDSGFGTSGYLTGAVNQELAGLALAPDGGFYISQEDLSGSSHGFTLLRFLSDGSVDTGFNSGNPLGVSITQTTLTEVPLPLAVQPDGKIFAGVVNGQTLLVERLLADGSPDTSFTSSGYASFNFHSVGGNTYAPQPTAVALQSDGEIIITGFTVYSTTGVNPVAFTARFLNNSFALTPGAPGFNNVAAAPLAQAVTSNAVSLSGLSIGSETSNIHVALSVQNGRYSTSGSSGPFMGSASGAAVAWIGSADNLALEQMTPATPATDTVTHVSAGGFWAPNNYQVLLGTAASADWTTTTDTPPVANDGTLDATAGQNANGTLDANNPGGGTLTYSIVSQPAHGTLSLNDASTGSYTYTANSGYSGNDSFTWKVNDGVADSNMATIAITVSTSSSGGGSGGSSGGGSSSGGGGSLGALTLCLFALLSLGITLLPRSLPRKR